MLRRKVRAQPLVALGLDARDPLEQTRSCRVHRISMAPQVSMAPCSSHVSIALKRHKGCLAGPASPRGPASAACDRQACWGRPCLFADQHRRCGENWMRTPVKASGKRFWPAARSRGLRTLAIADTRQPIHWHTRCLEWLSVPGHLTRPLQHSNAAALDVEWLAVQRLQPS